ncbi:uncharacterized protein LOC141912096 [Tubulanus polymorphus]|uniref:uncharacterized protein LOC141912096 n=1 Tax=Tubulanus polymorphus TaxID=672921 RepID=UPI003DA20903
MKRFQNIFNSKSTTKTDELRNHQTNGDPLTMATAVPQTTNGPKADDSEKKDDVSSPHQIENKDGASTGVDGAGGGKNDLDKAFEQLNVHTQILADILINADSSLSENSDSLCAVEYQIKSTLDEVRQLTDTCEDEYMTELSRVRTDLEEKFDKVKHKVQDSIVKIGLLEYMLNKVKVENIELDDLREYTEKHLYLCLEGLEDAAEDLERSTVDVRFDNATANTRASVVGQLVIEKKAVDEIEGVKTRPKPPRFRLDDLRTKADDDLDQIGGRLESVAGLKDGGVLVSTNKSVRLFDDRLGAHKVMADIRRTVRGKGIGIFTRDSSVGDFYRAFDSTVMRYRQMDNYNSKGKVIGTALACTGTENNVAIKGGIVAIFAYRNKLFIGGDGVVCSYPVSSFTTNRIQDDDLHKHANTKFIDINGKVSFSTQGGIARAIFANQRDEVIVATDDKLLMFGTRDGLEKSSALVECVQIIDFSALLGSLVPRRDWSPNPIARCINSICKFDENNIFVFGSAWQVNYSNLSDQPKMRYTMPVDYELELSTSSGGSEATLKSVSSLASEEGAGGANIAKEDELLKSSSSSEKKGFSKYLASVKASFDHSLAKEKAADQVPISPHSSPEGALDGTDALLHLNPVAESSRSLLKSSGLALEKSRVWSVEIDPLRRTMAEPITVESWDCFLVDSAVSGRDKNHLFVCYGDRKYGHEQVKLGLYHVVPVEPVIKGDLAPAVKDEPEPDAEKKVTFDGN